MAQNQTEYVPWNDLPPNQEPVWHLGQCLAWVATRDLRAVAFCKGQVGKSVAKELSFLTRLDLAVEELERTLKGGVIGSSGRIGDSIRALDSAEWVYLRICWTSADEPPHAISRNRPLKMFRDVCIRRDDVMRAFPAQGGRPGASFQPVISATTFQNASCAIAQTRKKVGAKPKFDWDGMRDYVFKLLDERGDFAEDDQEQNWSRKADVVRAVCDYIKKREEKRGGNGIGPSDSVLRGRVGKWVQEWRDFQKTL